MLNILETPGPADRPTLLIAHGLYGSGRNWGVIAKRLSDERRVISVDMRNHGASPWFDAHGYPDMAHDLVEVIVAQNDPVDVMGHSMGGKAAMVLALTRPDLVNRLIVADIAPVPYTHTQVHHIHAMRATDLTGISRRSEAGERLAPHVEDPSLIPFFLQSLNVEAGTWRYNLDALEAEMDKIIGFPDINAQYSGDVLFLSGGQSDYVLPEHRDRIKALFPKARFAKIPGAGHWLHAEKPREFELAVRTWLG